MRRARAVAVLVLLTSFVPAWGEVTTEDRSQIQSLLEEFRQAVLTHDRGRLEKTFGPSLPADRKKEIADKILSETEGYTLSYTLSYDLSNLQEESPGRVRLSGASHSVDATKGGSHWSVTLPVEFSFEKVALAEGTSEWKILSTDAEEDFGMGAAAKTAISIIAIVFGVCFLVVAVAVVGIIVLVRHLSKKKAQPPGQAPMPGQ